MKIILEAAFNSLSFGNVSYNILRELWKKDVETIIFPIGDQVDFGAFQPNRSFIEKFSNCASSRLKKYNHNLPTLKIWHINESEKKLTNKHFLYTFHELDFATEEEVNIVNSQTHTFFSSDYSRDTFAMVGADEDRISSVPLGFDPDLHLTGKTYQPNKITFGLMGKFENRKYTDKILRLWASRFGNNSNFQLNVCVYNTFFSPEQNEALIRQSLGGKRYSNINIIPYLKTNIEVNEFLNANDIDLSGLSGAEGWGLPAFNETCLGKWSIVLNSTSHKDWATKDNCILVEPNGKQPAWDGVFFKPGQPFNQGNIWTWNDADVLKAFDVAVQKAKTLNVEGLALSSKFNYGNTVDKMLKVISETK